MKSKLYIYMSLGLIGLGQSYVMGQTAGTAEFSASTPRERVTPGTYSFKNDGGEVPAFQLAGSLGLEVAIDVDFLKWKMGVIGDTADDDASALSVSPRVSLLYGFTDAVSVEGGVKFLGAKDGNAEMSALRFGLGPRFDFAERSGFKPHLKAQLCLYTNMEAERSSAVPGVLLKGDPKDSVGIYLAAGLDYVVTENSLIGIALNYEQLLGEADLEGGPVGDFELMGYGLGLSYTLLF